MSTRIRPKLVSARSVELDEQTCHLIASQSSLSGSSQQTAVLIELGGSLMSLDLDDSLGLRSRDNREQRARMTTDAGVGIRGGCNYPPILSYWKPTEGSPWAESTPTVPSYEVRRCSFRSSSRARRRRVHASPATPTLRSQSQDHSLMLQPPGFSLGNSRKPRLNPRGVAALAPDPCVLVAFSGRGSELLPD